MLLGTLGASKGTIRASERVIVTSLGGSIIRTGKNF